MTATGLSRDWRLFDESGCGVDLPDERALELVARFSVPIRWAQVSKEIGRRQAQWKLSSVYAAVSATAQRIFSLVWAPCSSSLWFLWRLAPGRVRIWVYARLYRAGRFMYGPTSNGMVQRLPFNLFIKYCDVSTNGPLVNEYGALQLMRKHSDLVVPQPLDFVSDSERSYMVMSRIPGHRMGEVCSLLTDEDLGRLAGELNGFLLKLRALPKEVRPGASPKTAVTGATGGGCHHVRMELIFGTRKPYGPFATEQEFHDFILTRRPPAPDEVQLAGHDIVMTHGDLSLRNVIVDDNGRLAGVVDWEHAGWYPAYWEYTSFLYALESRSTPRRLVDMANDIFRGLGDFESELAVERRLWEHIF